MRRGSLVAGFLAAVFVVAVAAAVAYFAFDLRVDKKGNAASEQLTKSQEDEISEAERDIVVYCTEDRGPHGLVPFTAAVNLIVGVARSHPQALFHGNEFEQVFSGGNVPTMQQRVLDEADLIRRKCSEPRGLGEDRIWEHDAEYLREVADQLAAENSGS